MAIKQKKNGKYLVDVRDEYGTRIQRTFNTKTDARAFEGDVYKKKYELLLVKNKLRDSRYNIDQALDDFLATKGELRPSSIKKYSHFVKQMKLFCEALVITYVDEFTPDHGTLFYNELVKKKLDPTGNTKRMLKPKPKTVNFFIQSARSFFTQEVIKDHIKKNPLLHIKTLKVEKPKPEFYTVAELKSFFQQEMTDAYRNAFFGLLLTGMRFGELANLTWEDIDFQKRLLFVRSNENFRTKTHNSERAIPMIDDLYKLLMHIFNNKVSTLYPFCSPTGKQLKERRMLEACKSVAENAGIQSRAYLHKFRHTYATLLIHKGIPIESIKELLGHWSVVQTEAYAHNKSDHLHPQVSQLNKLLEK
jgi:site-specific recombinase XerD